MPSEVLKLAEQIADEEWQLVGPCTKCGQMLPRADFAAAAKVRSGRKSACKRCLRLNYAPAVDGYQPCTACGEVKHATRFRAMRQSPPSATHLQGRAYWCIDCAASKDRTRRYGITDEEYAAMLEAQGGACAICRTDEWGSAGPNVDHDHATGEVRGLLCKPCNVGIGEMDDDPARLRAAAEYIEEHAND